MNSHHAFVVEARTEEGIEVAQAWLERELGMKLDKNPDVSVLRYGLLSVEDARDIYDSATQAPFGGEHRALIISASRAYHEAQNALLKLFEEPPRGTYLFLILPSLGGLLPTLRSRTQALPTNVGFTKSNISEMVIEFVKSGREKRGVLIKKLTSGKDEEERRENREAAIEILNGAEVLLHRDFKKHAAVLHDIAVLRGHLYDRSAPTKMILEHLSLVLPKGLV